MKFRKKWLYEKHAIPSRTLRWMRQKERRELAEAIVQVNVSICLAVE